MPHQTPNGADSSRQGGLTWIMLSGTVAGRRARRRPPNMVAVIVRSDGYHVLIASDGEEALELSRRYDGHIHLLISDIEMPGMSGIELANRLTQERPQMRVLLISGHSDTSVPPTYQFLAKPIAVVKLRDVMVKLLVHRDGGSIAKDD